MSLRTRLLLGYGYLVVLLALSSASAAIGFYRLSRGIDVILQENFASVRASMDMLAALERQDSATLTQLIEPGAGQKELADSDRDFQTALERARGNVTLDQERPLIQRIEQAYARFGRERQALFAARPAQPLKAYRQATFVAFEETKAAVLALLDVNHAAMRAADRSAQRTAVRSGVWLGALVFVALVSLIYLSRQMQRGLLRRLRELRQATEAIAHGETRLRMPESGEDELGWIARWLNEGLDVQDALQKRMEGLVSQQRQLVLGLLSALEPHSTLLALDGGLLAGAVGGEQMPLGEISGWIRGPGKQLLMAFQPGREVPSELAGSTDRPVRMRLLVAGGTRPVAWLAQATSP